MNWNHAHPLAVKGTSGMAGFACFLTRVLVVHSVVLRAKPASLAPVFRSHGLVGDHLMNSGVVWQVGIGNFAVGYGLNEARFNPPA
jgi:hypothetical protein